VLFVTFVVEKKSGSNIMVDALSLIPPTVFGFSPVPTLLRGNAYPCMGYHAGAWKAEKAA